ncbi:hypothetical protein RYX36_015091 [Vicia faba]
MEQRKLVVMGIPWDVDTEGLKEYMSKFGELEDCYIIKERSTGRSRSFGYVTFTSVDDAKELISFVEADKREEFKVFSREVVRFGNTCKDPQWHNLDRYFLRSYLNALSNKQPRVEAEKTMQDLSSLAQNTAELYHELNSLDRFQQDYNQKVKELESLNLPLNG